jgi:hypothetical protein
VEKRVRNFFPSPGFSGKNFSKIWNQKFPDNFLFFPGFPEKIFKKIVGKKNLEKFCLPETSLKIPDLTLRPYGIPPPPATVVKPSHRRQAGPTARPNLQKGRKSGRI